MAITVLPINSNARIPAIRSKKIDRFFKSKKRFNQNGFIELVYNITLVGGTKKKEYGYSADLKIGNDKQYYDGIENAFLNLLAKVMHREGQLFDGSDDIKSMDDSDIEEAQYVNHLIYYPNFKNERTIRVNRKRKDGSISSSIRFIREKSNGRFIFTKGGGVEYITTKDGKRQYTGKDEEETVNYLARREASYSKSREKAKDKAFALEFKEALEQGKGKSEKEQKKLLLAVINKDNAKIKSKKKRDFAEKFK